MSFQVLKYITCMQCGFRKLPELQETADIANNIIVLVTVIYEPKGPKPKVDDHSYAMSESMRDFLLTTRQFVRISPFLRSVMMPMLPILIELRMNWSKNFFWFRAYSITLPLLKPSVANKCWSLGMTPLPIIKFL